MKPSTDQRLSWLVVLGFSLLLLLPALLPALKFLQDPDPARIVNVLYDDTYYYLQIAYNLAHHGHSSFDGITTTNGYQPLWLLLLTLLAKLTGPDKTIFFWASVALTQLLALYAIWMAPKLVSGKEFRPFYLTLLMAFIILQFNTIYTKGLETVLTPFFIIYLLMRLAKPDEMLEKATPLGLVFAFAFLVRLDAIAVVPAYLLFDFMLNRRRLQPHYLIRLTRVLTPLIVTGLIYAALNQYWFGTPVPVSGLAKALDTGRFSNFGILYNYLMSCLPLFPIRSEWLPLLFWGAVVVIELLRHRLCGRLQAHGIPLLFLLLCAGIQYLYYACFSGWNIWPWYLYYSPFILFFVIARTATSLLILARHLRVGGKLLAEDSSGFTQTRLHTGIAITLLLTAGLYTAADKLRAGLQTADPARLTYAKLSVQQCDLYRDKTIAFGDRAGSLGYWCPTRVVQTEGLVMSRDFLRARAAGTGEQWLDDHYDIDLYVVDRDRIPVKGGTPDVYIVVDPIQGRTAHKALLHYCFPATALLDSNRYGADASRFIFDYRQKIPCDAEAERIIADIQTREGMRRYSLPAEYRNSRLKTWLENIDRQLADLQKP